VKATALALATSLVKFMAEVQSITSEALVAAGMQSGPASRLAAAVNGLPSSLSDTERWHVLTTKHLTPCIPFAVHRILFDFVYAGRSESDPPAPAWLPTAETIATANVTQLARARDLNNYGELWNWANRNRGEFWKATVETLGIRFQTPESEVLPAGTSVENPDWFAGALLNITDSCFQADRDSIAIISQRENGEIQRATCGELQLLVDRVANAASAAGFAVGDHIGIMLTMTPASVAAFLGLVRAGCVPVSIAESFAPPEIEVRLQLAKAKAVFVSDVVVRGGKRLPCYQKLVDVAGDLPIVVVPSADESAVALRDGHMLWNEFLGVDDVATSLASPPAAETNILFSSGTTGIPKAIPWTQLTPIKCAADARFHQNVSDGNVLCWPTSLGWMMGPWLIYASLLNRSTMALFDGDPTSPDFCRFVMDAGVTMLGVVPSLVRAWRNSGAIDGLNWDRIEAFSSTGECSNSGDILYLMSRVTGYSPVIEYCGGTEIGGGYITGTVVQPSAPGTFTTPALGIDFELHGHTCDAGEVFLVPPSIGLSQRLINGDHHANYFAATPTSQSGAVLRRHGDQMDKLPGGYYRAAGRTDDTMNLSGIKVSAVELEHCLNQLPEVYETAAIAASGKDGGPSQLVIHAVVTTDTVCIDSLRTKFQAAIKQHLNPLFRVHRVILVDSLPRTASNKLIRRTLRDRLT
jgi:acetyl-CoA synthetase